MVRIEKFKAKEIRGGGNDPIIETVSPISVNINGTNYETSEIHFTRKPKVTNLPNKLEKGLYVTIQDDIPISHISLEGATINNKVEKIIIRVNGVNIEIEPVSEEEKKQIERSENQKKVLAWINDGHFPNFDYAGYFVNPEEVEGIHKGAVEDFPAIFRAIKEYIKNNSSKFFLSKEIKYNKEGIENQWWAEEVSQTDPKNFFIINPLGARPGMAFSGIREICYGNGDNKSCALFPGHFTKTEYEELKNLLPADRACKVSGCYNNYSGKWNNGLTEQQNTIFTNENTATKVVDGMCMFHKITQKHPEWLGADSLTPEDVEHNRKVDEYQKKISPDIGDNNFWETMNNFLVDASGGKFDEVDRDLVNKIRAKYREEDKETGARLESDSLFSISRIKVSDNTDQKKEKRTNFKNLGAVNEAIIKKRTEIIKLIKDLQKKQDEYINQNNKNNKATDNGTSDNNQSLSELRKKIISLINNALHNQEPKISASELEPDNRNWEQLINKESISQEEMNNLKERVLFDISGKREAKFSADRLKNLVTEAKKLSNYEELAKKMSSIEKFRGQSGYSSLQSEINDLEMKLAQLKPENYRKDSVQTVNQKLAETGVKKSDLSSGTEKELGRIENGEITDPKKIKEIKDKSMNEIAQKCSDSELDKIIKEYASAVTSQAKNAAKRKLYSFISSSNDFHKQSYQKQKDKVNKLLGIKINAQEGKTPSNSPFMPVVIGGTLLIFLIGVWLIIRHRRVKKKYLN